MLGGGIPAGDQIVTNSYGYEYAIRLDFDNSSYQVYALDDDSRTQVIHYTQNISSNPYKYIDGGDLISTQDNDFTYVTYNTDVFGLTGGDHNVISGIDLEFLGAGQDFWAHFTIECGNDNLMGAGTTPRSRTRYHAAVWHWSDRPCRCEPEKTVQVIS